MDSLKREIRKTLDAAECTFYDQDALDNAVDELAAAVRSFMGSPAVVSRAEHAAARVAAVGVGSLDVPVVQMTRAALSAAIGEDIGGGRGAQD